MSDVLVRSSPWLTLREALGEGGRLVQIISDLVPNDAASADTVAWQRVFEREGVQSPIYGRRVESGHGGRAARLGDYRPRSGDVVLLKYTVWSEAAEWVRRADRRHVLVYYNVTPPEFFSGFDPRMMTETRLGRSQLSSLAPRSLLAVANSEFSRGDLVAAGFDPTAAVPVLLPDTASEPAPDASVLRGLMDGRTNVLCVGRLAPNKRVEQAIGAFAYYRHRIDPTARLFLVGGNGGSGEYLRALRRLAGQLDLDGQVHFTGSVPRASLVAYYRAAHVFVTMSEHEGFCVPLIEAMRFDVPIVARAATAIPETAGDAALLLGEPRLDVAAELIHLVRTDDDLRDRLVARGRIRAEMFAPRRTEATFAQHLVAALGAAA